MKINLILSLLFTLIISSCGNGDNNNASAPGINEDVDKFITAYMPDGGMPEDGDEITFKYPKFHELNNKTECIYFVEYNEKIIKKTEGRIELRIRRKHSGDRYEKNPSECPSSYPNLKAEDQFTITHKRYADFSKKRIGNHLNPVAYCGTKTWCTRVEIIEKKHMDYYGIDTLFIKVLVHSTSGKIYERESWISKESLQHSVYQFDLRNFKSRNWIDFQDLITVR